MKIKKLTAIVLTAAMLLCMVFTSFAEENAGIPENILRAKELSDRLSNRLIAILPDGSIVASNTEDIDSSVFSAYAALDTRKIVAAPASDIAMLTHSGKLYQGARQTAEGIADIVYCTNNVNQNGYALTTAGTLCYMHDEGAPNTDSGYTNPEDPFAVLADSERHDFFYITESGKLLLDAGEQYAWFEPVRASWTDLVHVAAAKYKPDSEPEAMTIIGIRKDGTTVVAGDYAEEILGWGNLSWVAGAEDIIVGVKEDGTLGITGERGRKFREDPRLASWKNIACVDVGTSSISAIDTAGNYYFASFQHYDEAPDCAVFSPDAYFGGAFAIARYYPDGTVCVADNKTRTWNTVTDH